MIEELIGRAFGARNLAHVRHFTTKSYAQHIALGEFYAAVIEAVDALVECYQGQFGLIGEVSVMQPDADDLVDYLREEADWIEANRDAISNESSSIGNLVDNLVAVYLKTIYKLENLA